MLASLDVGPISPNGKGSDYLDQFDYYFVLNWNSLKFIDYRKGD